MQFRATQSLFYGENKMGKSKLADAVSNTLPENKVDTLPDFKSLKDMAYAQAKAGDDLEAQAKYALAKIVGFPEECSEASRAELDAGYLVRFTENLKKNHGNPFRAYAVIDNNYILITPENAEQFKGKETLEISPSVAMHYSRHEFGRLHETRDPQYKTIIKLMRDDISDYCSGRYKALVVAARKIVNKGKTATRAPNKSFGDRVKLMFDDPKTGLDKAVLVAVKNGDPTADAKRFSEAKVAFFAVWNHA